MSVEECTGEGAIWKNPNRCCWTPISLLATQRVLVMVMVNYEAAEGIRNTLVPGTGTCRHSGVQLFLCW